MEACGGFKFFTMRSAFAFYMHICWIRYVGNGLSRWLLTYMYYTQLKLMCIHGQFLSRIP